MNYNHLPSSSHMRSQPQQQHSHQMPQMGLPTLRNYNMSGGVKRTAHSAGLKPDPEPSCDNLALSSDDEDYGSEYHQLTGVMSVPGAAGVAVPHPMPDAGFGSEMEGPSTSAGHGSRNPSNGKKTKGRVKIKMEFIDNKLRRYTTFSKRKTGIMKKVSFLKNFTHISNDLS